MIRFARFAFAAALTGLAAGAVHAQDCKNRGELDAMYCDENKDLVADTPKDKAKWKNPSTIVFTYTPVEDPAVYQKAFSPFTVIVADLMPASSPGLASTSSVW